MSRIFASVSHIFADTIGMWKDSAFAADLPGDGEKFDINSVPGHMHVCCLDPVYRDA